MKHVAILLLTLALIVVASGCYTVNGIGTPADATISMSNHPTGAVIKHFTITSKVHHLIYGLVTLNDPEIAKTVSDEVKAAGGTSAINVRFRYEMTFVDGLVNTITFAVYNPFTLTVEGDVVK
jgi:hypothetical protein